MSFPRYEKYKDSGVEWLGEVPEDWESKKFRYVFEESPEKVASEVVGDMLSVSGYRGIELKIYEDDNRRRTDEELIGYRIVRPGQLVVNTMWLNYAGLGVSEHEGHVSPAYRSYWIKCGLEKRYIHHLMRSKVYVQGYTQLLTGIRPNSLQMSRDDLMGFPVLVPSSTEQTKIASFLDYETVRIDALIAEQQRLIDLLKEKRQAVISHAVTKGLDSAVPMKDSGVEWLGEVPEGWAVKQLKHVVHPASSITYGIVQAGPEVADGIPYIKTSDMSGDELPLEGYSKTSPEIDASYKRSKVSVGDIVVAIRATVGKCLPVPPELEGANLTQGTAKVSPGDTVLADYLLLSLSADSAQAYFSSMSKGATFKEITLDALRRTPLALPPLPQQSNTVAQLKALLNNLEALISEATKTQSLLQERRSALISAAVTGKIDVRNWQPPASPSVNAQPEPL